MRGTFVALTCLATILLVPSAWAVPDFTPGPDPSRIVLNPTASPATSQSVTWRTDSSTTGGRIEYQPSAGGPVTPVEATTGDPVAFPGWSYSSRHHSVRLTGLSPDTGYRYRVGSDGHLSEWSTFRTAASGYRPWTMLYFGDVQRQIDTAWAPVADMAFTNNPEAKIAIYAGDLINQSSDDTDWGYFFAGLGEPARTINQIPVIGNHELSGDNQGIQFREHFTDPGNGPEDLRSRVGYTDYQGVRIITLDGNQFFLDSQVAFLEQALAHNPNKWTVVSLHQPVFSGEEGHDYPYIRDALLPVLEKYDVDLVLQGHDHAYSRGYVAADFDQSTGYPNGPVFVVSVAGPMSVPIGQEISNSYTDNGAVRVKAFEKTATYQPISFDGNTLTYRSFIAGKGDGSNATGQVGDLLDAFTITRLPDGSKVVSEGETPPDLDPGPDPEAASLKITRVTPNFKRGSARITVVSNSDGRVTAGAGQGRLVRNVSRAVSADRPTSLTIRAARSQLGKLRRRGRLSLKLKVRFDPETGRSRSLTRRITLKLR